MVATTAVLLALAAAPPIQEPEPARLLGRFVDADGGPVAGVEVRISNWPTDPAVPGWTPPDPVVSDADGRFEIAVDVVDRLRPVALATHGSLADLQWQWKKIEPGETWDLGEQLLERPASVTGSVVDREGGRLIGGWTVRALPYPRTVPEGVLPIGRDAPIDPATGTYRIDGLIPGRLLVTASTPDGTEARSRIVRVDPGETREVDLRFRGPVPSRRIGLAITCERFGGKEPEPGTVFAVDGAGVRFALERVPDTARDWQATGLQPGTYTLEIADPRFLPWRREGVATGEKVSATLEGSSGVRLTFVGDLAPAEPKLFWLYLREASRAASAYSKNIWTTGQGLPPDGRIGGFLAGDYELEVRMTNVAPHFVDVRGLGIGETREVEVELRPAAVLRGRVLRADGAPAAGVKVQVTRGEVPGHDDASKWIDVIGSTDLDRGTAHYGYRFEETVTDDDGAFSFAGLSPTTWALRAIGDRWIHSSLVVDARAGGEHAAQLVLPAGGSATVELSLPETARGRSHEILVEPVGAVGGTPVAWTPGAPVDSAGGCELAGLPAGRSRLTLRILYQPRGIFELPFGEVEVEPGGRATASFDLRARYPVEGAVEVRRDGEPKPWATARLTSAGNGPGHWSPHPFDGSRLLATPGDWLVEVSHPMEGWSWASPEVRHLRPFEPFLVQLDLPVVERSVCFVDGEGAPIPGAAVLWSAVRGSVRDQEAVADGAGCLALELPPAEYRFRRRGAPAASAVTWHSETGPDRLALE